MYHDITYSTTVTKIINQTLYSKIPHMQALEYFCEDLLENWPCYNWHHTVYKNISTAWCYARNFLAKVLELPQFWTKPSIYD